MATRKLQVVTDETPEVTMTIEDIDPNIASDLLENVGDNRKVSEVVVRRYSRQMKDGEWHLTGEPIIIDQQGRLADGQHRLWAVIESGATIKMSVVRGIEPKMFNYMNTGKSRSLSDILTINGYSNAAQTGVTANAIMRYLKHGDFHYFDSKSAPTPYQVVQFLDDNPGIVEDVRTASRIHKRLLIKGFGVSVIAPLYHVLRNVDEEDCAAFFDQLVQGLFTETGDPVYVLRERLMKNAGALRPMIRNEVCAITIKAWNAWRKGEKIKILHYKGGGSKPEPFPVPV